MGKGGGGTNTTNTVTNSSPPPQVLAQYENLIGQSNQVAQTPYTTGGFNASNMLAGFTPDQTSAFNTVDQSQGIQNPYLAAGQADLTASQTPLWNGVQQYSPATMAQYANPYLNTAVAGTEAQMNNMDAQQQQQVVGNAVAAGAWGGDRSAIAQSELANQQSLANNQTISNMENTGFNQQQGEFNTQQASQLGANEANAWLGSQGAALESGLGTTAQTTALNGATAQYNMGTAQQQQNQSALNIPYEQFQAEQAYPFQTLQYNADISEGLGSSSGGTGTGSTTTPAPNAFSQDVGTAAGLGTLGYLGYLALEKGGRVPSRARGGFAPPHRASGGFMPQHFDLGGGTGGATPGYLPPSSFGDTVPGIGTVNINPQSMPHGSGPPNVKAPMPYTPPANNGLQGAMGGIGAITAAQRRTNGSPLYDSNMGAVNTSPDAMASGAFPGLSNPMAAGSGPGGTFGISDPSMAAATNLDTSGLDSLASGFDFNKGGFVPKHYDGGGGIGLPTAQQTGASPGVANVANQLQNMTVEQLQQLNARSGGRNPQIQMALQRKQMTGGAAQQPQQAGMAPMAAQAQGAAPPAQAAAVPSGMQPQNIMQQQGYARGGFTPQKLATDGTVNDVYPEDAGGSPDQYSKDLASLNATLGPQAGPSPVSPSSTGLIPPPATANNSPGMAPLPSHDDFMKQYNSEVANATPYNKPDPVMALLSTMGAIGAGRSSKFGVNAGQGAVEGIQNWANQNKEAASESERKGTLQEQGEQLYNNMVQHKEQLSQENERLQETTRHNQADEANARAERQKPIPDGFGGFLIPNPADPTHPSTIYPGAGTNSDGSNVSMQNVWKQPVGADGKPITGEDYYKTLPPPVATEAKMIANGDKAPPSSFASKNPTLLAAEAAAKNGDPSYTGTRFSTIQDFTKGTGPAATVQAQTAVMEHIPILQKAMDAMDNGDTRVFNSIANNLAKQRGDPAPTNFEAGRNIVFDEVAKAVLGPRSTLADREEFVKNASTSASGKQLAGQLDEAGKYMAGQQHALENRWVAGTGFSNDSPNSFRDKFINPKENPNGRALYEKYYPNPLPPADKREVGKTYYGPGGKPGTWTANGWVSPDQGAP